MMLEIGLALTLFVILASSGGRGILLFIAMIVLAFCILNPGLLLGIAAMGIHLTK